MKTNTTTNLQDLVLKILNPDTPFAEIENSINNIHQYFHETIGIASFEDSIPNLAAVNTAKGKALGMNHAAKCLLDYKRTVKFLKGMVAAIKKKQAIHPNEKIHIFYAGCGPYAPFVTLVAQLFTSEEIQFDVLEINALALDHAKKLISGLGLNDYVGEYYQADAITFQFEKDKDYHILYSETLDALLFRECYVPILFNMLPQLSEDIYVVPNNVQVSMNLSLMSMTNEEYKADKTETILDVRQSVLEHASTKSIPKKLPQITVNVKELNIEDYNYFSLDTKVNIFEDIWLERNESSLTIPLEMEIHKPFDFSKMVFTYEMKDSIELKYQLFE
ncbi:SAM-dependent methyltransferase [Tenacibaculum xiamenense]|uniref:phytanoyl-CoA dioxygenase n=1 Tax=Tenacibaculum xiamenense TaxID=1261553 RepID=UPI00389654A6